MEPKNEDSTPSVAPADPVQALADYKAKTVQWKKVVKGQLDTAASKNEALRKELGAVKLEAANAAKNVRVELAAEFKERTQMKDEDVARLEKELVALRHELSEERIRLRNEAKQAAEREDSIHQQAISALQKQSEAAAARAADIHKAELERGKSQVETLRMEASDARSAAENAKHELAALENKIAGDQSSRESNEQITALQTQLKSAKEQIAKWQQRHTADAERYEANMEQLTESRDAQHLADVARRDEQLAVTQSILRATQRDLQTALVRQGERDAETTDQVNTLRGRMSSVTAALAAKVEQLRQVESSLNHSQALNKTLEQRVTALTEETAGREAAFNEMFASESDANKEVFSSLQTQITTLAAERDKSVEERRLLTEELRILKEEQQGAAAKDNSQQSEIDEMKRQMATREKLLSQREQNLLEMKQQLADEAGRIDETQKLLNSRSHATSVSVNNQQHATAPSSQPSSASSSAYRIGPAPSVTRDAALMAFLRYRKFFPTMIIVLMLVMIFWWSGSGASAAGMENSLKQSAETTRLRMDLQSAQQDLVSCEAKRRGLLLPGSGNKTNRSS